MSMPRPKTLFPQPNAHTWTPTHTQPNQKVRRKRRKNRVIAIITGLTRPEDQFHTWTGLDPHQHRTHPIRHYLTRRGKCVHSYHCFVSLSLSTNHKILESYPYLTIFFFFYLTPSLPSLAVNLLTVSVSVNLELQEIRVLKRSASWAEMERRRTRRRSTPRPRYRCGGTSKTAMCPRVRIRTRSRRTSAPRWSA